MSEDPAARRLVTPTDIIGLAELLDRFVSADDPESAPAKAAEREYEAAVVSLFDTCVKPYYSSITLHQFRGHVRWRCRQFLALQARKPPTKPSV